MFLAYCENKCDYRIYNRRILVIEEVICITFDEANHIISKSMCEDDDVGMQQGLENQTINDEKNTQEVKGQEEEKKNDEVSKDLPKAWKFAQHHSKEFIIGDPSERVKIHSSIRPFVDNFAFILILNLRM